MSRVILQFGSHSEGARWIQRQGDGWSEVRESDLKSAALAAAGQPVDVLVPAEDVLLTEVAIAARQHRRLMQALPFAVEEQLAGDVADYHFALGMRLGEHRYLAAAVSRQLMEGWLRQLDEAGLEARSIVPEVLAVPLEAGWGTLVVDGHRAMLRVAPERGYAAELAEMPAYIELEPDLKQLIVLDPEQSFQAPPELECKRVPQRQPLIALLAEGLGDTLPLNLLQGDYPTRSERSGRAARIWTWAAAVAVLALCLALTERWLSYRALANEVDTLRQQSSQQLRQAFPDVERVVNPRLQMEQRLSDLRAASGGGSGSFLYLLRLAGPTLLRARELDIRSINYRDGGLVLDVQAPSLSVIEAVRQRMLDGGSLGVELESAATLADGADARLRVWGLSG